MIDGWDDFSPKYLGAAHSVSSEDYETKYDLVTNIYLPPPPGYKTWQIYPVYRETKKDRNAGFKIKR